METKIHLSEEEWSLVKNAEILLTKNRLMKKISEFLGELANDSTMIFSAESVKLPLPLHWQAPKISKGENFQGLPYLILDHPRFFFRDDVFAIRTMFWWGNYFSVTLHLKGIFCQHFLERILDNRDLLTSNNFLVNISDAEWNHAITSGNYQPLSEIGNEEIRQRCDVDNLLKLAVKIPLGHLGQAGVQVVEKYSVLADILCISSRGGGRDL